MELANDLFPRSGKAPGNCAAGSKSGTINGHDTRSLRVKGWTSGSQSSVTIMKLSPGAKQASGTDLLERQSAPVADGRGANGTNKAV